jgi:hypothetical protein
MGLMPFFIGILALAAVLLSVVFVLEGWQEHPVKAVVSSVTMLGIGIVILLVVRLAWREALRAFSEIKNEPPSWGNPPSLPTSKAPAPNPPKE